MRKQLGLILAVVLLVGSLAACSSSSTTIKPDAEIVPVPAVLVPEGQRAELEESKGYFETTLTAEELITFYQQELAANGKIIAEKSQSQLAESGFAPEPDAKGTVVWAAVATYGTNSEPISVVIAEENGTHAVSLGAGFRAKIVAKELSVELPSAESNA